MGINLTIGLFHFIDRDFILFYLRGQVIFYSAALVPLFSYSPVILLSICLNLCLFYPIASLCIDFCQRMTYSIWIKNPRICIYPQKSIEFEIWKILGRRRRREKEKEIDVINNGWGEEMTRSCPFEDKATDHILSDSNVLKIQRSSRQAHQVVHAGLARAWINWIKKSFSRGKGKGFPNDWALFFRREMHSPSPLIEKCN